MAQVVILGAGLTGLSAAYHFEKKNFSDFAIFEKEPMAGGLCRSVQQNGFTFDYTGHLLHVNDPYFESFLKSVVGLNNFNSITRKSFIFSHNGYSRYPFQINLHGLPTDVIVECIEGFLKRKQKSKVTTFPEWAKQNFGTGIAKHFFMPYQKKIFAYPLDDITASWTGRFVPKTSLKEMIHGAIQDNEKVEVGYNAQFLYPKKGGIEFWIQKLAKAVKKPIKTDYSAEKIDLKKKVITFSNGHVEPFTTLINTMPLDTFINKLVEKPSTTFNHAANKLYCNSVVNFNLGINHESISEKHWIYFPEKQYPFYRIGFPHNFSKGMTPPDTSSLYGEFAHINKSKTELQKKLALALKQTKKLLNISDSDILTEKTMYISHAYVIYNFWRERNLPKLLQRLEESGIYSCGRYGEWKYSSMQEGLLDGKKIADRIVIQPAKKEQPPKKKRKSSFQQLRIG